MLVVVAKFITADTEDVDHATCTKSIPHIYQIIKLIFCNGLYRKLYLLKHLQLLV